MNQIAHAQTAFNPFNRNRAIIFSLLAVALAVLSFHGALDNLAFSKLAELKSESFELLLISGGINAAVSVLQTIEFKIPFISSAQIGQVLDPINDAAERLTVGLLWAIGSLFLQEILLKIASGWAFKWGFLALTALTAATLLLAQSERLRFAFLVTFGISHVSLAQYQGILIKTFVVVTVFRFIVPAFAVASILVSQALVAPEINQHTEVLQQHEEGLSNLGKQISEARDEVINEQKSQAETLTDDGTDDSVPEGEVEPASLSPPDQAAATEDVQAFGEQKAQLENKLASFQTEMERLTDRINEKEKSLLTGLMEGFKRRFADSPTEAMAEADAQVEQTESEVNQLESQLACIDGRATGEQCDLLLSEHRDHALSELKRQLDLEQAELGERLDALQAEREKHLPNASEKAQGEEDSGWGDAISGRVRNFLGDDPAEEMEAVRVKVEEVDREMAKTEELAAQKASELACVDRRIAGKDCVSRSADAHIQAAVDTLKTRLESDLLPLREELASRQDVRERLQAESAREEDLEKLREERRQIESSIEEAKEHIERKDSQLECAERRVAGKDCDTLLDDVGKVIVTTGTATTEMVSSATDAAGKGLSTAGQAAGRVVSSVTEATSRAFSKMGRGVLDGFKAIVDGAQEMVERMANILILVIIENIVLPIAFLAIAVKGSVPIARSVMRISTSIREDTREALSALDQALPGRTN